MIPLAGDKFYNRFLGPLQHAPAFPQHGLPCLIQVRLLISHGLAACRRQVAQQILLNNNDRFSHCQQAIAVVLTTGFQKFAERLALGANPSQRFNKTEHSHGIANPLDQGQCVLDILQVLIVSATI